MSNHPPRFLISGCLVTGAVAGIAGTFMPTASLRGLLCGIDGIALIVGTALLALSRPRPFFAYPFLAATLVGWALHHFREAA